MSRTRENSKIDFGQLPPLPVGWRWERIEDAATKERNAIVDGPFGSNLRLSDYIAPPGVAVLTTANLRGDYGPKKVRYISRQKFEELKRSEVRGGDILVAKIGSCGLTGIYPDDLPSAIIPANLLKMTVHPEVSRKFVFYYLNSPMFSRFLTSIITATAQPAFNVSKFRQLPFPFVCRSQQDEIVAEIEKQFTRLDAGVTGLQRVQANLKRYRAAILKGACEGKLVPTEAELARQEDRSYETGVQLLERALIARREWFDKQQIGEKTEKGYRQPVSPNTSNLPTLPEGWIWATWDQLSNWVTYGFTRPMPHVNEGIPIVTAKNVNGGKINFGGADLTKKEAFRGLSEKDRPKPNDILITKDGTIGRAAVVDTEREFCINQSVAVIWLRCCPMERKYLLSVIASELTQKPIWAKARGVAIQHLSITDFAKLPIPIPPLGEQQRIVAEVDRRLSVVEELEAVVNANLKRATRLRQSILQSAFCGDTL